MFSLNLTKSSSLTLIYAILFHILSATTLNTCSATEETSSSPSQLRHLSTNLTSIYFIGDLHGDVECAKEWVKQTKLVNLESTPYTWVGEPTHAIVFAGDYVDKGSTSSSVLAFVRELQTTFRDNVVSILGNHDFFQVLDAALEYDGESNPHPLRHPQHDYAYSFVHPEEYVESGYSPSRDDDEELMKAIHDALQYVYDRRMEGDVRVCTTDYCVKDAEAGNADLFTSVPPFLNDEDLANKARERLLTWRNEYAQGLYDTGLLHWMVEQPLLALVGDTLLVHGGLGQNIVSYAQKVGDKKGLSVEDALYDLTNRPFTSFFKEGLNDAKGEGESGVANSIKGRMKEGFAFEIILNIVQHRGYFDKQTGCQEVESVLSYLQGEKINRICVGHTPRDYAEELCGGKLLASDSSLSRSFRAYGNHYCPLNDLYKNDAMGQSCSMAEFVDKCDGSVSLLVRESPEHEWPARVQHLTMNELMDLGETLDEL